MRTSLSLALMFAWAFPMQAQTDETSRPMPDSVRSYVIEAVAAYRSKSVHATQIDWDSLQTTVLRDARGAQVPAETWPTLTAAFRSVDRHSFVIPAPSGMSMGGFSPARPRSIPPAEPLGRMVSSRLGYVAVLPHGGVNRPSYVDSLHAQLQALDSANPCGWIVDLRRNSGGNMWPMLAGIGALLGSREVGWFTTRERGDSWRYQDGKAWYGGPKLPASPPGHGTRDSGPLLRHADAPVALLLGSQTQSSGEMTAIAFFGRPNLKSFGDTTGGYASANTNITLRDGAQLVVTSAYPRDRNGRAYALQLAPDVRVASSTAPGADAPLDAAATWLSSQPRCGGRKQ